MDKRFIKTEKSFVLVQNDDDLELFCCPDWSQGNVLFV